MTDRLYDDADLDAGARAITAALGSRPWRQMTPRTAARAVLETLTAAGWHRANRWHVCLPAEVEAREVGGTTGEEDNDHG